MPLICCAGDYHKGAKSNSPKFNKQLSEYTEFAIQESVKRNCEYFCQFGDYFDNRTKLDISTLNSAIDTAKKLCDHFGKDKAFTLVANHDMYFNDTLEVTSTVALEPYLTVVKEPTIFFGNTVIAPWVVDGKAWDQLIDLTHQPGVENLFGHLELNGFLVTDRYEMEHGYSPKELGHLRNVLSGHYHGPQVQGNIRYIGSALPITMNEANEAHGIFFFDTDTGEIEFVEYHGVKVVSADYREIEPMLEGLDPENTTVRVTFPDDLEDITEIKAITDTLDELGFKDRKIQHTDTRTKKILELDDTEVKEVENIDAVVASNIKNSAKINGIDNEVLGELYEQAKLKGDE